MTLLLSPPERALARPVLDLEGRGDRTALWTPDGAITYAELAQRAGDLARDLLGSTRRLVLLEGANRLDALVGYLAALEHGHVILLVPDGREAQLEQLVATYDPDVVLRSGPRGWTSTERREHSAHQLHPDLALLLSTSGSTGSPQLVRLSHDNLRSNALSITESLGITIDDRAMTSLPMHYCYGLSVVNSHLVSGAGLVLSEESVVDECFWDRFEDAGATTFAGVPYTFDLLDSSGFDRRPLPTLRYVTQAGGRLAPDRVRRYAELGGRNGWELVVMYGQTEATARMAYLPPEHAPTRSGAVGVPVPGGSFRIDPVPESPEPGTGELVYTGPNVMMGYAEQPADLAAGATLAELRTGDLARRVDGLYEIVGRRSRHAKLFGLRIDLDRVEQVASEPRLPIRCVVVDDVLHAFTTRHRATSAVHDRIVDLCGIPSPAVRVTVLDQLPLTASGKPDHAALGHQARLVTERSQREVAGAATDRPVTAMSVRDDLALVLGRPDATVTSSFVGLGGDSLSYVELATRLGSRLGELPPGWHTLTATELADRTRPRRRWGALVDTTVVLRALAIVLVVGTHANLFTVVGGAHLLLAVVGFNLARFQLGPLPRRQRVRNGLGAVAQVAVPSALFIGVAGLVTGMYDAWTAVFLNGLLGSDSWTLDWQFWFLEALVWGSLGTLALMSVPVVDRWERRAPFAFAVGLVVATLAVRFAWTGVETGATERYTVGLVLWFVAVGWAAASATSFLQRGLLVALAAVGCVGYFGDLQRELVILSGIAVLVWVPVIRLPRWIGTGCGVLAAASLSIYLTHWQVYPHLELDHPWLATGLSLAVGIAFAGVVRPLTRTLRRLTRTTARP